MTETNSIYALLDEYAKALRISFAQDTYQKADDRVQQAHIALVEATNAKQNANDNLNELCDAHPNVRPPQIIAADIVKGHQDQ